MGNSGGFSMACEVSQGHILIYRVVLLNFGGLLLVLAYFWLILLALRALGG